MPISPLTAHSHVFNAALKAKNNKINYKEKSKNV